MSGLFGGLAEAPVPRAAVGMQIDAGPYKVTILSARAISSPDGVYLKDEANHLIGVRARVEITADGTWYPGFAQGGLIEDILRLYGIKGMVGEHKKTGLADAMPTTVILGRDGTTRPMLHPGLPEEVEFLWEQKASADPPEKLIVQIYGMTFRTGFFSVNKRWHTDHSKSAALIVPVDNLLLRTKAAAS